VKWDFKANATFENGATAPEVDLGMKVPQAVMLSLSQGLNERWAVVAGFGWQNWSQFGKVDIGVKAGQTATTTVNANYQDT
jgi:long-chain fatty acid transport protein